MKNYDGNFLITLSLKKIHFDSSHFFLRTIMLFFLSLLLIFSISSMKDKEEIAFIKHYSPIFNHQYSFMESRPGIVVADFSDWMFGLSDDLMMSQISLPGTHESCTMYGDNTIKCQDLTLIEQLQMGVRVFDIRCKQIEDVFMIHHEDVYQNLGFASGVRDVMIDFLRKHQNEFIFMIIKEEGMGISNTKSFEDVLMQYIEEEPEFFYMSDRMPNVRDVRGKIVLIKRFKSQNHHSGFDIEWLENSIFTSYTSIIARVQDCSFVTSLYDRPLKWDHVNSLLKETRFASDQMTLYINFASGSSKDCSPIDVDMFIKPLLGTYLSISYPSAFCGVLMMDYIESNFDNIIYYIIDRNFQ